MFTFQHELAIRRRKPKNHHWTKPKKGRKQAKQRIDDSAISLIAESEINKAKKDITEAPPTSPTSSPEDLFTKVIRLRNALSISQDDEVESDPEEYGPADIDVPALHPCRDTYGTVARAKKLREIMAASCAPKSVPSLSTVTTGATTLEEDIATHPAMRYASFPASREPSVLEMDPPPPDFPDVKIGPDDSCKPVIEIKEETDVIGVPRNVAGSENATSSADIETLGEVKTPSKRIEIGNKRRRDYEDDDNRMRSKSSCTY
jgi:hypothetical protein